MWRRLSCTAFVVALAACGGDTDLTGPGNTPDPTSPGGPATPAGPASLAVSPDSKTLLIGAKLQLSITAKDLNGNPCDCKPTYSSSDAAIATVSADGVVTAKALGEAWITVLCVGGVSAKAKIVVVASLNLPNTLEILPVLPDLKIGASVKLSIIAKDIAGLPCDCKPTYTSSNVKIAVVSSDGVVTAKAAGEVWITVTCVGGVSAKVKIVVKAVVATLTLDPVKVTLKVGSVLQLKVVAKDINGLPVDCEAVFASLDPLLAKVTETTGLVTALLPGLVEISATCDGISAKTTLTQIL